MFCSNCGIENAEGAVFCKNCGKNLTQPSAPVKVAKPPLSNNPTLNVIKKVASSPLFLVAIIAYSVQILGSVIVAAGSGPLFSGMIYNILYEFGADIPYELYDILDGIAMAGSGPVIVGTIIGLIPTILICIGLWITYASARSRLSSGMKTSGLTMIKVITIIQLVGDCLTLAAFEIFLMFAVVASAAEAYGFVVVIFVFIVILGTAMYILQIIYLSKIVKSINTAKNTIATGVPSNKVSSFLAVWAFVSAAGFIFSLPASFISSAAAITSLICFGLVIFKYKAEMRALMLAQQNTTNPTI